MGGLGVVGSGLSVGTGLRLRLSGRGCDVQRFDVKDHGYGHVQLESLILAQNERWRQA